MLLLVVSATVVAGLRLGLSLGTSILLVAFGLGMYLGNIYTAITAALGSVDTWLLVFSTLSIALLAELYRATNAIDELGRGLTSSLRDPRLGLVSVPAVIGLMPVAGGALLSAPLVEALGVHMGLSGEVMAYLNVWFRHTLIYSYPFAQLLIVLSQLTGISILTLVAATLPLSIFMAIVGIPPLLKARNTQPQTPVHQPGRGLLALIPIGVGIALTVPLTTLIGNWAVPIGTSAAILILIKLSNASGSTLKAISLSRVGDMVLAVVAALILREVIALSQIPEDIMSSVNSIGSTVLTVAVLSTLVSVATGSVITGLFVTLPILPSIGAPDLGSVLLVYTYSFLGYIASPTHLCLLYTVKYFRVDLVRTYRYLIPSVLAVLVVSTLYYLAI